MLRLRCSTHLFPFHEKLKQKANQNKTPVCGHKSLDCNDWCPVEHLNSVWRFFYRCKHLHLYVDASLSVHVAWRCVSTHICINFTLPLCHVASGWWVLIFSNGRLSASWVCCLCDWFISPPQSLHLRSTVIMQSSLEIHSWMPELDAWPLLQCWRCF